MSDTETITIGKIVKPFGVRGQVRVLSLSDVPGRLENLRKVTLETSSGHCLVTEVTDVQSNGRSYVLRFSAFSTPEEVGEYRGAWLKIPKSDVPPAPEGHHYQFELIGLTVKEESGHVLGMLEEVVELPSQHLFVIRGGEKELLLPASRKWVLNIDIPGQVMIVAPKTEWVGEYAV